jgi:hypothetical protein
MKANNTQIQLDIQAVKTKMSKIKKALKKACPALRDQLQKEYVVLSVELEILNAKNI